MMCDAMRLCVYVTCLVWCMSFEESWHDLHVAMCEIRVMCGVRCVMCYVRCAICDVMLQVCNLNVLCLMSYVSLNKEKSYVKENSPFH